MTRSRLAHVFTYLLSNFQRGKYRITIPLLPTCNRTATLDRDVPRKCLGEGQFFLDVRFFAALTIQSMFIPANPVLKVAKS